MRYISNTRRDVLLTEEVQDWLETCHRVGTERARIVAKFRHTFTLLRQFGLAIGYPHIDKIGGYGNLWEVRVDHGTGAYRAFFGLATDGAVILVAHAAVKKSDRFPPRVYEIAARKVREAVERYEEERSAQDGETQFFSAP